LVKPLLEDAFSNLDEAFRLKLAVFELMIRFELKDFDYLEHKTERIKKEFKNILKLPEYKKQVLMINVISKMIFSDNYKKEKSIVNLINEVLRLSEASDSGDADIVNYPDWLKSKLN